MVLAQLKQWFAKGELLLVCIGYKINLFINFAFTVLFFIYLLYLLLLLFIEFEICLLDLFNYILNDLLWC